MVAKGKRFESNFEKSLEVAGKNVSYLRLYDPGHGYGGVRNPCDFVVYNYPNIFYLELKEQKGDRINFSAAITENQFDELKRHSKKEGVIAGILFKFYEHDLVYFINIDLLDKVEDIVRKGKNKGSSRWSYQLRGEKSLTPELAEEYGVILVGEKKRVNWLYDVNAFLRKLRILYG